MSTQTEPAPYTQADYDADQAATEQAAAGKWEQHAQPGFEAKVGEIAVDAAHDLADDEDAAEDDHYDDSRDGTNGQSYLEQNHGIKP